MRSVRTAATLLLTAGLFLLWAAPAAADQDQDRIEQLQREVAELREMLTTLTREGGQDSRLAEIERRIEILGAELESMKIGEAAALADQGEYGLGPAASKIYRTERGVSVGGYGEMFYEHFASEQDDGTPVDDTDRLDFLRAVLYFGYKFNDRFLFNSEVEFEHASTDKEGSVSVEFAYIDYLWREAINVRAGLVLLPMGFVNELHEPTVFLGARRSETESLIIPSTWRENGVGLFGDLGPFTYRTFVVNGLDASGFTQAGLRGGRQKGSKAKADDFAWVGRFDYVGSPGLTLGASGYVGDSGQGLEDAQGRTLGVGTTILEGHVEWRWRGLELRALAARAELDDVAALNEELALTDDDSIGETQLGAYAQLGYDVLSRRKGQASLVPFIRYEHINTQDEVPEGWTSNPANDRRILTVGLSYLPITQLVIKAEYQDWDTEADSGVDRINLALGYVF